MNRILLLFLCALGSVCAHADNYDYLVFQTVDGEQSVTAVGTVITFSGDNMVVNSQGEEVLLPLANLQQFFFSALPAGIDSVSAETAEVTVYTVSGQFVGRFADARAMETALPKGLYVAKGNGETRKLMVK